VLNTSQPAISAMKEQVQTQGPAAPEAQQDPTADQLNVGGTK
jgi:hypothetical protein